MLRYVHFVLLLAAAGCSGSSEDPRPSKEQVGIEPNPIAEQTGRALPEQVLDACTSLAVDRGGYVPIVGAQLRDILQPTIEGAEMKWEKTESGYILRLTKADQLSGHENQLGVEFSVRAKPITGVTYCGPMVVKVERGIYNSREMSSTEIGRLLFTRFASTPRFREIEAASREQQERQLTAESVASPLNSNAVKVGSRSPPREGRFRRVNGDIRILRVGDLWKARIEASSNADGPAASADCSLTAEGSFTSGLGTLDLVIDDPEAGSEVENDNLVSISFTLTGLEVREGDTSQQCGNHIDINGYYPAVK